MKTKTPYLIIGLFLCAAQSAHAALVFTFSDGGSGNTLITVSGDTATAGGSGGGNERDDIGFSISGVGSVRQTGFSQRQDDYFPLLGSLSASGSLSDTISLTSTGITGGSPTEITGYQFDSSNFYLVMDGLANNTDTLSFAGSPDVTGLIPLAFTEFTPMWNQSFTATNDNFTFAFVPEPSSAALLLGLGGLALARRRRR